MTNPLVATYLRVGPPVTLTARFASFAPRPTAKDFTFGELTRYFVQQANQPTGEVTEVSQGTYTTLQSNHLFRSVAVRWRIAGPADDTHDAAGRVVRPGIETANRAAVTNAAKTMPNITNKLTNLTQLWQGS